MIDTASTEKEFPRSKSTGLLWSASNLFSGGGQSEMFSALNRMVIRPKNSMERNVEKTAEYVRSKGLLMDP